MAEILFHGAAGEVTGSMHLVHVDGRWVALDCGLFQGRREESEAKNRQWPINPKQIDAVVLSHAHADHAGRLPRLVKEGFDGPIFCTPATRDLCAVMLPDSAHIQEEDVFYVNKKRRRKGLPPIEALYDRDDALGAIRRVQTISYDRWFPVVPGLLACFLEAGHMLGSAGVRLEFGKRNGSTPSLYFTGDVGRPRQPILRDPAEFPASDVVICESTYGGRVNESVADAKGRLTEIVKRTYGRGGKVIVPAFSVGRTQTIVYYLQELMEAGVIPRHPVFVDSPLAADATEVFRLHPECYDADARTLQTQTGDMLGAGCCTYVREAEESKRLHRRRDPCTIISASGMCEYGRIRHHLKNNLDNERNTVLIPGFQAQHTLGRRLVEGAKQVTLFHESYEVRAEVAYVRGFSGHADQADLLRSFAATKDSSPRVYLVHGEDDQAQALASKLLESGLTQVTVAQRDQRVAF